MKRSRRQSRSRSRRHRQRGGNARSCSARPSNRQMIGMNSQRGGVAPFDSIGGQLLSGHDQIAAGVGGFYEANATAQQMASLSHSGGRRSRRHRKRKGNSRRQRGGNLASFDGPYSLSVSNPDVAARFANGVNGGSV